MAQHDRLPRDLRLWLAQAALPWSAQSALKLWTRSLRATGGDVAAASACLSRVEARLIARDAVRVWGAGHPAALEPMSGVSSARDRTGHAFARTISENASRQITG